MKTIYLALALSPLLLLTGCADSAYVGVGGGGYYDNGPYYGGPGYSSVNVAYYNRGGNYHHYDNNYHGNYHGSYARNSYSHGSTHSTSVNRTASTRTTSHTSRTVSSGNQHIH